MSSGPPVVRVDGLSLALESGEPVVEDVSFTVAAGEVLGLVGESGSGKTTTALALLGYTRPGLQIRGGRIEVPVDGASLESNPCLIASHLAQFKRRAEMTYQRGVNLVRGEHH